MMTKKVGLITFDEFEHEEMVKIAGKICDELGFTKPIETTIPYGLNKGIVDIARADKKGKTIAVEVGNLNGSNPPNRVASILLNYDSYLHIPYLLSWTPNLEEIAGEIEREKIAEADEIRELNEKKKKLEKRIEELQYIINETNTAISKIFMISQKDGILS